MHTHCGYFHYHNALHKTQYQERGVTLDQRNCFIISRGQSGMERRHVEMDMGGGAVRENQEKEEESLLLHGQKSLLHSSIHAHIVVYKNKYTHIYI
mmetsp:Transcript_11985/g.19799  ORF Transcript_11985/g.19799 Transcript_11985/m.19799 type:complete len:96 (+) Transcript_11985:90-377(+)